MPDLADQQFIPGQIPILINDKFALTIENFSVQKTRASSVATGFAGNYAKRKGVAQFTFSFDMPPLATGGFEIPLAVLESTFKLSYRIGAQPFDLDGCDVNDEDLAAAMQSGNTTAKFRGNALNRVP
jgi:hypothetical protein